MPQYLAFNKPYSVLSQFTPDHPGQRTLAEFCIPPGLYPAGRLDHDSEGLLLLTDDGSLIEQLLTPGKHPRSYLVQVEGTPDAAAIAGLRRGGIQIQHYRTMPCDAEILSGFDLPPRIPPIRTRATIPTTWLRITLREGKNRQVRKMTAAIGFPTLRLIRDRIGPIELGSLEPGQWRQLDSKELASLRAMLQLVDPNRLSLKRKGHS